MDHTPGPWRYMEDGYIVAEDGEGCLIARVETENAATPEVVRTDGLLLAAAPELLAALERIAGGHYTSVGYAQMVARAAIKRATA